jgi:hypothetical protein
MQKKGIKVELSLMDDINKALDAAMGKKRVLVEQGKKVSAGLNNLQVDFAKAFQLAIKASNQAKELGVDDAARLFAVRADEAKDMEGAVGKAANKVFASVDEI